MINLTKVDPLLILASKLPEVMKKVDTLATVEGPESEREAISYLATIKKIKKQVETAKKQAEKPYKDEINVIRGKAEVVVAPLEEAEGILKRAITAWHNTDTYKEAEKVRIEAEQARSKALWDAKHQGMDSDSLEALGATTGALTEAQEDAPRVLDSKHGRAHFREYTRFEVVELSLVPQEYLEETLRRAIEKGILESVLREQIGKGLRDIPGIRTWTEQVPIIKTI